MNEPTLPGPIAYLTGQYPKVSHTFIQREVAALRERGVTILTCTVRRAAAKDVVGDDQLAEQAQTFCILGAAKNPLTLLGAHVRTLRRAPGRWFSALRLAWKTRPPGPKAMLWQFFYFLEAGVLADHLLGQGVRHLHNHFADSSGTVAMLTSEMSGIPYSFTMHGPTEFFDAHWWQLGEKVSRAAFVAAISHFCRSQLMYFTPRAHWDRIRIVHCGVVPERYGLRPRTEETAGKRILFIGRLDAVKGPVLLVEAFARILPRHPEARLIVVGDGPDRADAEARARELGVAPEFLGYRPQEAVAGILEDSDLLVLPSFAEGVPVVLMEAMASRIPVISTRIAGIPELVEDGVNGLLLPPGDMEALVAALDRLLADPALRIGMGAAGRAKVEAEYTLGREADWLHRLFAGSLAGKLPEGLRPEQEPDA